MRGGGGAGAVGPAGMPAVEGEARWTTLVVGRAGAGAGADSGEGAGAEACTGSVSLEAIGSSGAFLANMQGKGQV